MFEKTTGNCRRGYGAAEERAIVQNAHTAKDAVCHLCAQSVSMDRAVLPRALSRSLVVPHIGPHQSHAVAPHQSHAVAAWAHMGPSPRAHAAATAWGLLLSGPSPQVPSRREVRVRGSGQQQPAPLSDVQQRQRRRDASEIVEVSWAKWGPSSRSFLPLPVRAGVLPAPWLAIDESVVKVPPRSFLSPPSGRHGCKVVSLPPNPPFSHPFCFP